MKKLCVFCMALLMLAMTACGKDTSGGGKDTSGGGQSVDLRAAYEAAIAQVNEELGDNAPALLEETAVEMLNGYYPGIADIQLKQSVFFLSPTATSCEVAMVEVADSARCSQGARHLPGPCGHHGQRYHVSGRGRHVEKQRHCVRQRELRGAGGAAGGLHRARRISGQILTLRCIFPPYVV